MATDKTPYKAVIFDLGGVLVSDVMHYVNAIDEKLHIPKGYSLKLIQKTKGDSLTGKTTIFNVIKDMAPQIAEQHNIKDPGTVIKAWHEFLEEITQGPPDADMIKAVKKLRANGYKTAILSNSPKFNSEETMVTSCKLLDKSLFDVVIDSAVVGMMKPQPEIYQLTLEKLGVSANEVIFLDDFEMYVNGARALGIKSIQVDSAKKKDAITELSKELGLDLLTK